MIYTQRGFKVNHALLDGEFVPLRTDLLNMGIVANFATRNEHVPEIERQHRVIKKRARACCYTLPFEVLPRLLLVEMINNCALWINMFPEKGGVINVSPKTLMTGVKLDYNKHFRFPFGSYVQVHDEPSPTNSPTTRTIRAITLGPTGNLQGGFKFLNLWTGKKITIRNWTHLPMPIEVIKRVNEIGTAQGQPTLLTFQDRHVHDNNDPDPYFHPIDCKIEGVIDDEPSKENVEYDHKEINNDPANQGEEVNEANEAENENKNEVPTLADGAEI